MSRRRPTWRSTGSARNDRVIVYRSAVTTLPMDARMTGIYLGAAATVVWLVAARRLRASRTPAVPVLAVLASFVVALAVDGFNALLVDLRLPTIYEPSNVMRMATGVLAGIALGSGARSSLCQLGLGSRRSGASGGDETLSSSLPRSASRRRSRLLALSDLPLLYAPFAVGLVVAAVGVFWLLGIVVLALLSTVAGRAGPERPCAAGAYIAHRRHRDHRRSLRAAVRGGTALRASQVDIVRASSAVLDSPPAVFP